nr:hypothetical protein [Deltaproteobacteria bacterium]
MVVPDAGRHRGEVGALALRDEAPIGVDDHPAAVVPEAGLLELDAVEANGLTRLHRMDPE